MICCRSILYAPFAPFIVIFCHVIEGSGTGSEREDLSLLEDFVLSLHPICPLSEAIEKLYRLCHVLVTIARLYVEAKARARAKETQTQTQEEEDQRLVNVGLEFDTYLSALGLAPGEAGGDLRWQGQNQAMGQGQGLGQVQPQFVDSSTAMNQTMQLGNWFSGNQYMMGLLEEDLDIFNGL